MEAGGRERGWAGVREGGREGGISIYVDYTYRICEVLHALLL